MTKNNLKKLKIYFKEIYPHVWKHYNFLFKLRTDNKRFELLLASESLLTLTYVTIFQKFISEGNLLFLIPLFSFFIPITLSLSNLIPIRIWFPWFEKDNIKKVFLSSNDKDFYEEGLRSIYGVVDHAGYLEKRRSKIYGENVLALYLSIVVSFICVFIYVNVYEIIPLFLILSMLIWILIRKNWNRESVEKNPAPEVEKFFDDWKKEVLGK